MRLIVFILLLTFPVFAADPLPGIFHTVSSEYSVDYALLSKIADIESGFNPNATTSTSSAKGLYQILRSTENWLRELCDIEGDIFDPLTNTRLGACYVRHNQKYLRKKLKRDATYTECYLSHFMGAVTALKLLRMDRHELAAKHFKRESEANRNVFYKGSKMRTVGEVIQYFEKKMELAKVL